MLDQEPHQRGVLLRKPVVATEAASVARAQCAVVAAAALGDVVKQGGDVQQPGLLEVGDQLAAQRVLVRVFGQREPTQVAQHLEDVLIDGVDVEKIVLHLPHDAPEHRQVAAQHGQLVHAAQLVQDALGLLQDREKGRAVGGIAAIGGIDPYPGMPQCAHQRRRHAAQLLVLCHQQERAQDAVRIRVQRAGRTQVEQFAARHEGLVQRLAGFVRQVEQALLHVLQHDRVHLGDRLGRPVIALHQHFAWPARCRRLVAGTLGHRVLHVEHQAILAPAGHQVQPGPDLLQPALAARG